VLEDGSEVGRHEGYAAFTVGQRKGLPGGFPEPMFVTGIRPDAREVVIGPRSSLASARLVAVGANWLAPIPAPGTEVGVRIRHQAPIVAAAVERADAEGFTIRLSAPQNAVTPGQSAVLYKDDELVLGGGVIAINN
jgi:tRNA-specific 2-thiouridylase